MVSTFTPPPPGASKRSSRVLATGVAALATACLLLGSFAVWAQQQALSTDGWTKTSVRLIANPTIQKAIGDYLVQELFDVLNVNQQPRQALPDALASPLQGELRQPAEQLATQVLSKPSVQGAWRDANREAHRQLLKILNGSGSSVSTPGGVVTLNLGPLVRQLAKQVEAEPLVAALPTNDKRIFSRWSGRSGQLVIMRSDQLKTAQDVVKGIRGLNIVLPIAAVVLFALSVWLPRGWRRVALRRVGWSFVAVGIALLVSRRLIEPRVVDALVSAPSDRPAANAAWLIATSQPRDAAEAIIAYGAAIIVAGWLAGSTRLAGGIRRLTAGTLRERPVLAYVALAVFMAALFLWGPTPALRQPLSVIGIFAVLAFGLAVMRRQTVTEFPRSMS